MSVNPDAPGSGVPASRAPELLARDAAGGDEAAFAELYALLEPVAVRSARRAARTHPQLDIDEAVNIALTRVWRGLGGFDVDRDFLPWAAVVIAHAVRSAARTCRSAKSTINWGAMLAPPAGDGGGAHVGSAIDLVADVVVAPDPVEAAEDEDLIRDLLHEVLSHREARALRMRMAGSPYAEIADALDVNLKAVDNALRRAGEKMRLTFGSEQALVATLRDTPGQPGG